MSTEYISLEIKDQFRRASRDNNPEAHEAMDHWFRGRVSPPTNLMNLNDGPKKRELSAP